MGKREFLEKLEEALLEKMNISEAMSHIIYYKEYIENEVAHGKSESEVVKGLQSPRLVAKAITSNKDRANKYSGNIKEKTYDKMYNTYYDEKNNTKESEKISFSINGKKLNGTILKILLVLLAIIFVVLLFVISGVVIWLIVTIALPIMMIGLAVGIISKIFFKRK